ncbi:MAG: 4Fe-4S dicluster domain-containing protein [Candidatus Cryptobacteroides sp.]
MLRKIRTTLAIFCFFAITLLFLDFTGTIQHWLGWLAKIQLLPSILAANFITVAVLLVLTLIFGRVYCSVICPLGVFQDGVFALSRSRKSKKMKQAYSKEMKWLRYTLFVVMVVALLAGLGSLVALLAPYSAWGRIVQSILSPVWQWGNNLLALIAQKHEGYAFATREVWLKSLPTLIVAVVTLVLVSVLAWRNGRTYCNTVCPVGTFLSFFARFAMFRPIIDKSKCRSCRACERKCKASCIDIDNKEIDYSRCVDCFDCLESCKFGALEYAFAWKKSGEAGEKAGEAAAGKSGGASGAVEQGLASEGKAGGAAGAVEQGVASEGKAGGASGADEQSADSAGGPDSGRRAFLIGSAIALGGTAISVRAQSVPDGDKKRDGGFAEVLPKIAPSRNVPLTPFGSRSVKQFYDRCTACQLCVTVCPNKVLRPSSDFSRLMQPEMSYEKGYCRPECVRCSEVCPAGAILPVTPEEKTGLKIGTARINPDLCVVNTKSVSCGNCARHCPAGAITLVSLNPDDPHSLRVPSVIEEACIGCGACENLCPARPLSAITVEGVEIHHAI